MEFFDRKDELRMLKRIREDSVRNARFTVLVGRRRIGKTELLKRAFGKTGFVYLFIARRTEAELCEIGSWWDRKGENEIDIIAENELSKTVSYYEVKRDSSRYSPKALQDRIAAFLRATGEQQDYVRFFNCLSLEAM